MADFPGLLVPYKEIFSPATLGMSVGGDMIGLGQTTEGTSVTFPAANRAIFVPFVLGMPFTAKKIYWQNGLTVNGNVDVGVYDQAGNRLVSFGSVAQSGASAQQVADITDTTLAPGRYYMALASSSATATFVGWTPAVGLCQSMGLAQMATAFALPATATFATVASAFMPDITISGRTAV